MRSNKKNKNPLFHIAAKMIHRFVRFYIGMIISQFSAPFIATTYIHSKKRSNQDTMHSPLATPRMPSQNNSTISATKSITIQLDDDLRNVSAIRYDKNGKSKAGWEGEYYSDTHIMAKWSRLNLTTGYIYCTTRKVWYL